MDLFKLHLKAFTVLGGLQLLFLNSRFQSFYSENACLLDEVDAVLVLLFDLSEMVLMSLYLAFHLLLVLLK
jgi:hypothetical protein